MAKQKWLCVTKLERVWNNFFVTKEGGRWKSLCWHGVVIEYFIHQNVTYNTNFVVVVINKLPDFWPIGASLHCVWKSTYLPEIVDLACGNIKHTQWWKFPNQIILMISFPALCQFLSSDLVNNLLPVHSKFPDGGTLGICTWKPLFAHIDRRISIQTVKIDGQIDRQSKRKTVRQTHGHTEKVTSQNATSKPEPRVGSHWKTYRHTL